MNIQQYYQQTAHESLNASIISLLPVIFFIFTSPLLSKGIVLFASIPFLFYSFISYQKYSINKQRAEKIIGQAVKPNHYSAFDYDEVLIGFLPAPSLRMVFFEPGGNVVGEIKDLNFKMYRWLFPKVMDKIIARKYGFFDEKGKILTCISIEKNMVEWSKNKEETGRIIQIEGKNQSQIWSTNEKEIFVHYKLTYTDIKFYDKNNQELARLRKGWMPVKWGQFFLDANTPILTFQNNLSEEDKVVIFTILANMYCYWDH